MPTRPKGKIQPKNPFEYGRELSKEELVDRREELQDLSATMRNQAKLFLIGPRRFGKTSLLCAAEEQARLHGIVVIRVDAEKYESLRLLAAAILTGAARALQGPVERTVELLGRVAARLRPEAVIGEEGALIFRLGMTDANEGELPLLTEALDAVERLAAETGREVVVILDEVQAVVIEHGLAAERQLRATIQCHRHVGYIFSGSATRLMTAMTDDPNRPFYRLGSRLFLGPIPRRNFLPALERGFHSGNFTVGNGACEHILDRANDVPYNVQRLAHEVWELLVAQEKRNVTSEDVDAALDRIVRREDPAYTQLWNSLAVNQKKALKAVISTQGQGLLSGEVARHFGITTSSLQRALESLESKHLIRIDGAVGSTRYQLVDPFVRAWIEFSQVA